MSTVSTSIRAAARVHRFTYAIRQVVAEAKKVEATGKAVRYLCLLYTSPSPRD